MGDLNVYSNGDGDEDVWGTYGWEYECFEAGRALGADIAYGDSPFGWDAAYAYQMYATGPYQNPPFLQQPNGGADLPAVRRPAGLRPDTRSTRAATSPW